jgi:hypothetical protein
MCSLVKNWARNSGYDTYKYVNVTMKHLGQVFILNKQKFPFIFQKQGRGRQNRSCLGAGTSGREEDIRKGCRRVNMVEILRSHVCKSDQLKLFQEWGGRGNRE